MIDGPAFFIVGPYKTDEEGGGEVDENGILTPAEPTMIANNALGENGLFLSRVGIFQPDSNGYLVDNTGNYVYGYAVNEVTIADGEVTEEWASEDKSQIQPIRIPIDPDTDAPYNIQTWTIGTDGTIVGVDESNTPSTIGKIAVASVENPSGLEQTTGYLYSVGNNAGRVIAMEQTSATGIIKSNFLEMSNVDLA